MWKSHSINIPKYLAEDVEICKMLELVKVEQERVEKLKKEVKTTMLRRGRFNWSTIVPMRGGWSVSFDLHPNQEDISLHLRDDYAHKNGSKIHPFIHSSSIIVPYLERYLAASLLCARSIEMLLYEIQFQGLSVHKLLMNTYNVREGWSFTKPGEGSPGVWFQWGFGKRPYTLSSLFLCTVPNTVASFYLNNSRNVNRDSWRFHTSHPGSVGLWN